MKKAIRLSLVTLWCLLSLGLLGMWVRSRSRQDQFVYAPAGGRLWQVFCHRGEFGFSTATPWPNAERPQFFSVLDPGTRPLYGPSWWPGPSGPYTTHEWLGLRVVFGAGQVDLDPDGTASWARNPASPYVPPLVIASGNISFVVSLIRFLDVYIPFWLPAVLLAAFPAAGALGRAWRRQRQRRLPGLCVSCGYDLRATPDAGGALLARCPECGKEARSRQPAIFAFPPHNR